MNRAELVETMAKTTGHSKAETDRWLAAFMSTIEKNIKRKEGIRLVGFGTFTTTKRKARTGRNPQTGEEIKIPARTVPVFRAGQSLKTIANKNK
ncbi:MAG: HU family DNA-binding protein [Oligoflexales bacterium]|nr:HU family DNA-binding protein [Oligoflexales bacterium]